MERCAQASRHRKAAIESGQAELSQHLDQVKTAIYVIG